MCYLFTNAYVFVLFWKGKLGWNVCLSPANTIQDILVLKACRSYSKPTTLMADDERFEKEIKAEPFKTQTGTYCSETFSPTPCWAPHWCGSNTLQRSSKHCLEELAHTFISTVLTPCCVPPSRPPRWNWMELTACKPSPAPAVWYLPLWSAHPQVGVLPLSSLPLPFLTYGPGLRHTVWQESSRSITGSTNRAH